LSRTQPFLGCIHILYLHFPALGVFELHAEGPLVHPHKNSKRGKVDIPNLVPITAGDETSLLSQIRIRCAIRTPDYRWQGQMKISENPCFMYGQNFKNFPKNVRIGAGIHQKNQNLFGLPIWPPKIPNLFGLANQASKNVKFVRLAPKLPFLHG
jgi:hypothetical protein